VCICVGLAVHSKKWWTSGVKVMSVSEAGESGGSVKSRVAMRQRQEVDEGALS